MSKRLDDMNFQEFVDHVTQQIHSGLLEGGGKEMRAQVHLWLSKTIEWDRRDRTKKDKKK